MKHILTERDEDFLVAWCAECEAIVEVRVSPGGEWRCRVAVRQAKRRTNLRHRFGITEEDYGILLSTQDGLCAICKTPWTEQAPLHVDHCHATGRVRGLLCFSCNLILGNAKDRREILLAAMDYLETYRPVLSD